MDQEQESGQVEEGAAEADDMAALAIALDHILRVEGASCVNGVAIRFMEMGEAVKDDSGGFRAKQSGVFTRSMGGGEWQYRGSFDDFNEVVRPILRQAGDVQCAVILLRSAILDSSSALTAMDKEIEADLERLLADTGRGGTKKGV